MNFLRWLVLERILANCDPGNVIVAFFVSCFIVTFITSIFWPWPLLLAIIVYGGWALVGYVLISQWLDEMREEWRQETKQDK